MLPYAQYLHRFPAYLQQLTMESNGKGVRWDGSGVTTDTGEVFWGEPGTNGQHAFYQLIHPGHPDDPLRLHRHGRSGASADRRRSRARWQGTCTSCSWPTSSPRPGRWAFGKTADEVRAEGTDEAVVPARVFTGNRPTTSIMAPALTPAVLGQLIALYEHITFTQGVVWGIDSFDQWGVELGKQLAQQVTPAVAGDTDALAQQDRSTQALISYYRDHRH